jgi:hypothetical protein
MIGRRRLTAFLGASLLAVPALADDFPTVRAGRRDRHAGAAGRAAGLHGAGRVAQASGVKVE